MNFTRFAHTKFLFGAPIVVFLAQVGCGVGVAAGMRGVEVAFVLTIAAMAVVLTLGYVGVGAAYPSKELPQILPPRLSVSTYVIQGGWLIAGILLAALVSPQIWSSNFVGKTVAHVQETTLLLPVSICCAVAIGIAEEIVFRGYLMTWLRHRTGAVWSIAISSAVFAGVHVSQATQGLLFSRFLLGVAFAVAVLRTRTLISAIGLHAGVNTAYFLYLGGISIDGQTILAGPQ